MTATPSTVASSARDAAPQTDRQQANARKAALAAFLDSMLEYYDFFIYGSAAALVFPTLFFAGSDPAVATVAALATFGVGYVARPLGGVALGHFGDRVGRKSSSPAPES